MEKNFLYIPKRLKVGFKNRVFGENDWENNREKAAEETKLGYVVYWDEKGELRKENSWEKWRDKSLGESEIGNEPLHGFAIHLVRNGYRGEWFSGRDAKVLVMHPQGFAFEITPENACSLIIEGGVEAGTGIIGGEQVLAWDKKELILLGTKSKEYEESLSHTRKVNAGGVKATELIAGHIYRCRNGELRLYFGKPDYYTQEWGKGKEKPSGDGWMVVNPYKLNYERTFDWKRNVLHRGEHVYMTVHKNCSPYIGPWLNSVKNTPKGMIDDLGEYAAWREVLDAMLSHVQWHGETYLDPIVEYREVEMSREEFADHLRKYGRLHARYKNKESFAFFSKTEKSCVEIGLLNFERDIEALADGKDVGMPFCCEGGLFLSLEGIMRRYCPVRIDSVTKDGRVVEWSSYLQRKDYSHTVGAEDIAGTECLEKENERVFPVVEV